MTTSTKKEPLEASKFAHDMRNVLSIVFTNAQILELILEKAGSEDERKIAHAISESVAEMNAMIGNQFDK